MDWQEIWASQRSITSFLDGWHALNGPPNIVHGGYDSQVLIASKMKYAKTVQPTQILPDLLMVVLRKLPKVIKDELRWKKYHGIFLGNVLILGDLIDSWHFILFRPRGWGAELNSCFCRDGTSVSVGRQTSVYGLFDIWYMAVSEKMQVQYPKLELFATCTSLAVASDAFPMPSFQWIPCPSVVQKFGATWCHIPSPYADRMLEDGTQVLGSLRWQVRHGQLNVGRWCPQHHGKCFGPFLSTLRGPSHLHLILPVGDWQDSIHQLIILIFMVDSSN